MKEIKRLLVAFLSLLVYVLGWVLAIGMVVGISFGFTALVLYGICWAFGWVLTFKMVVGVWLVIVLFNIIFK